MAFPLVIDVREACAAKRTGKGQWTYGFVTELLTRGVDPLLMTDGPLPSEWNAFHPGVQLIEKKGILWHLAVLKSLRSMGDAFYLSPTSTIVPAFAPSSIRVLPVIHDLIAFRPEPHDRKARFIERLTVPRAVTKAKHLFTVSESTKHDVSERFPASTGKISVVYAGPHDARPEASQPDGKTILCIATLCPRKNQLRLLQAFAALPDALRQSSKLILAGDRGWNDEEILDLVKRTPGGEWVGYIDDAAYARLLSTCTVFAFPSLYEGFGIPVLDAMQRGIPVLTSSRGSLAEVVGDAALLADPENVSSLASGLEKLLTDANLRGQLSAKGKERAAQFSWKRSVDLFLQALNQL